MDSEGCRKVYIDETEENRQGQSNILNRAELQYMILIQKTFFKEDPPLPRAAHAEVRF